MADEWQAKTLDQLGRVVTGKTPPSAVADAFGGYIPFVTPSDMDGSRIISNTTRHLSASGQAAVKNAGIPKDAVMVSCIGSDMGKAAMAGADCATNQQINSIIIDTDDSPLFVYYNLSTRKSEIRASASGSAQPILNKSAFGRLEIQLPPPTEQRAIAHILGTLDDKIELNRRRNQTLEAMARALFKDWFVDFGPVRAKMEVREPYLPAGLWQLFPGRRDDEGKPEGWEMGRLGDVAEHPRRSIQPENIEPNTPYIALEHMPKRCIALSDWGTAISLESNKHEFRQGEILFGKLRPYFHKVGIAPVGGVCSTDIVVVTAKQERWFGFLLCHVSSDEFVEYTNAGSTGTKMPRTSWNEMARYRLLLPPEALARAFNEIVRPWVKQIIGGIHESRTLARLRDTLLPKLISGELRIADAEAFMERVA